jgi:tRNA threonylcarbamoyladenosine biosynthesis protein TsaE
MSVLTHSTIVGSTVWRTEADTRAFAGKLASALLRLTQPGHALITLHGDLGAGKTTLVRHLLHALGVRGRIKSPTYGLVESYEAGLESVKLPIWHMDFYRFSDPTEWEHAGLRDVFASQGLKLVEWPERATGRLPPADLSLRITGGDGTNGEESRQVRMESCGPSGQSLIEALA